MAAHRRHSWAADRGWLLFEVTQMIAEAQRQRRPAEVVCRNASKTEPAKLLAVFVLDTNDAPLTKPIK